MPAFVHVGTICAVGVGKRNSDCDLCEQNAIGWCAVSMESITWRKNQPRSLGSSEEGLIHCRVAINILANPLSLYPKG